MRTFRDYFSQYIACWLDGRSHYSWCYCMKIPTHYCVGVDEPDDLELHLLSVNFILFGMFG